MYSRTEITTRLRCQNEKPIKINEIVFDCYLKYFFMTAKKQLTYQ